MNQAEIIIGTAAIAVIALDVMVRLLIIPHWKDRWLSALLDGQLEGRAATNFSIPDQTQQDRIAQISENLFRHFALSAVSRDVLAVLASRGRWLNQPELVAALNRRREAGRRSKLPAAVVRKVVMILMGADLVALRKGTLQLTEAGRHLDALLQARTTTAAPTRVFVSP